MKIRTTLRIAEVGTSMIVMAAFGLLAQEFIVAAVAVLFVGMVAFGLASRAYGYLDGLEEGRRRSLQREY